MKIILRTLMATVVAVLVFINYFHLIPYMLSLDGFIGPIVSVFFFILPFAVGMWIFSLYKDDNK